MKRIFAMLGAALLVALGLFLPRFAAAYQERGLASDVRRMENSAVSLTLAQEMIDLPELDLFESLELFSDAVTLVELENGRRTSAEDAARAAAELAEFVHADVYLDDETPPDETIPYLLTSEDGRSGIMWRCGWEGRPDEAVWLDDRNGQVVGFCLSVSALDLDAEADNLCYAICDRFFPPDMSFDVFETDAGGSLAIFMENGNDTAYISIDRDVTYFCFNTGGIIDGKILADAMSILW